MDGRTIHIKSICYCEHFFYLFAEYKVIVNTKGRFLGFNETICRAQDRLSHYFWRCYFPMTTSICLSVLRLVGWMFSGFVELTFKMT